jgi:putative beta-barrel porin MtrB/PioB
VVDIQPKGWLLARLSYSHGVKAIGAGGYTPIGGNADAFDAPGLPQFQKFDEADRTRDKGDVLIQVSPLDTLTLSGSFFAQKDNYFNSFFGLDESKAFGWSGDISWAPSERMNFSIGYAHDEYQSHEISCAIPGGPPATCNLLDTFFVKPRDLLDSVQANANFVLIPNRLDLGFGYRYTFGRSRQSVSSVPGGAAAGEPAPVPTTENEFHVFNVVARYFLTPQWTLKLGYQYERYAEKDFTTDGIGPALAGLPIGVLPQADARSIILGSQHGPYEAHIVGFSVAYRF